MNAGSRNQQSYGFEMNFLTKLGSTKSADQKTTLIHFLAKVVENKFPDVMDFSQDLRNIEEASRSKPGDEGSVVYTLNTKLENSKESSQSDL